MDHEDDLILDIFGPQAPLDFEPKPHHEDADDASEDPEELVPSTSEEDYAGDVTDSRSYGVEASE